jgi:hypothetical protein
MLPLFSPPRHQLEALYPLSSTVTLRSLIGKPVHDGLIPRHTMHFFIISINHGRRGASFSFSLIANMYNPLYHNKSEARSTKFETNSKFKNSKFKTKASPLGAGFCFLFWSFVFFGHLDLFRISNFGFRALKFRMTYP